MLALIVIVLIRSASLAGAAGDTARMLSFASGDFEEWTVEGENTWAISLNPEFFTTPGYSPGYVVNSLEKGEHNTGALRSAPFVIETAVQRFAVAGWDGTHTGQNDGDRNRVLLRSYPDGDVLRRANTPGGNKLVPMKWYTYDLIGRKAYLEIVDDNPVIRPGGFAWIAFGDYHQGLANVKSPVVRDDLHGLVIDQGGDVTACRTVPFLVASPHRAVNTIRKIQGNTVTIPIRASAKAIYLLGLLNWGWDCGVAHWGEHPELRTARDDQVQIGSRIGDIEIRYADGGIDRIPIVVGATAWFVAQWAYGPSHGVLAGVREPFVSRPDYAAALQKSLKIRQSDDVARHDTEYQYQYLAIKPRAKRIESVSIVDNPKLRGRPLVSAITLAGSVSASKRGTTELGALKHFGKWQADPADLAPTVRADRPGDWSQDLARLSRLLYTSDADLPTQVELIDFPDGLDAARIRFLGGPTADMLSNIWVANLSQMGEKFESDTGFFRETGKDCPWYGGYSGVGTWSPIGIYSGGAFARCSDHYATLALRCIDDPQRTTNYVDFCDKWLYYYRPDHDPKNGPDNPHLNVDKYPKDAPPHWAFVVNGPFSIPGPINELSGDEEMDGHGATCVARWVAWRLMGAPKGDWLTEPREQVYGKSRWDSTRDAAEFICWLMDHTGMDVIWSEGESTGWAAGGALIPPGMDDETDPAKIKRNYANANMYEPYPSYTCLVALRCSAQIADALGETELADRWRSHSDRIQQAMVRLLVVGDSNKRMWRVSPYSVFPSLQDSLVQAWFSIYYDGLDPNRWDPTMTTITRNTLQRQLSRQYGYAPVLAMGYGQGWLTKSALILDDMDSAAKLLANIAKYSYDKNMDYVDHARGIDWRKWLWLIPEGANIMPDGRWYRIGDLTNGANQGPAMHALELCAGIDDTDPANLRIMPRAPQPLTGIQVSNFFTLVPDADGLTKARVRYQFKRPGLFYLKSDRALPKLSVRLGPFDERPARRAAAHGMRPDGTQVRVEHSGTWQGEDAWWVWVDGLKNVSAFKLDFRK